MEARTIDFMPQVDINLKRGSPDARKPLVDFWNEKDSLSNENNIIVPYGKEGFDKWGSSPNIEEDIIIPIGKDDKGYVLFDFNSGHNLLAGGVMLSGAGMFKRVSLLHLLKTYSPEKVKVALLDTTNQMDGFDESKHLLFPRAIKQDEIIKILNWCKEESDRRFDLLTKETVLSISRYNKYFKGKKKIIPDIFIFISELGDLVLDTNMIRPIIEMAQSSRVTSIHFIITTQRPSPETMSEFIKITFFNRIAFQMPYKEESELFIGEGGAEKLIGQGDLLFYDNYNSKIHHLQGLYFLEDAIKKEVSNLNSFAG